MLRVLTQDLRVFLITMAISVVLLVGDSYGIFNLIKSGVQFITIPIQYGLYKTATGVGRQFQFIVLARTAAQENKAMTEQLAQVLSENAQLRQKLSEAQSFVDQQNTLDPQEFNLIATRPIGISRYLLIDKGSDNGIKTGQAVIYKDNFIGIINEVSTKKSKVMLSSDPDSKIAAFVSGNNGKAKGVLLGQFGAEMLLDKVLHQEPIEVGDLVYSEGTEVEIPRGLIMGQVSQVMDRDNEVFKQATVKPVFDVTNLDVVFVVAN
jgi:rod shape-determining protein MreC